jgi:tetratricopeptide (TPR) repeat protein
MIGKTLSAAALIAVAVPATAAVTVVGKSAAQSCYEAAATEGWVGDDIAVCNRALTDEGLTGYEQVATLVNRGILKTRAGYIESAITDFDAAIARDPDQAEAYLNKGVALSKKDGWANALPLFTLAIEKKTTKPALAYFGRGVANELTGDIPAAYHDYKMASTLAPDWGRPVAELSRFSVRGN